MHWHPAEHSCFCCCHIARFSVCRYERSEEAHALFRWDPLGLGADETARRWCVLVAALDKISGESSMCTAATCSHIRPTSWEVPLGLHVQRHSNPRCIDLPSRPDFNLPPLPTGTARASCSTRGGPCWASPASWCRRSPAQTCSGVWLQHDMITPELVTFAGSWQTSSVRCARRMSMHSLQLETFVAVLCCF